MSSPFEHLEDSDLWWRPNEESNSAGNLVLQLGGNARQWIVAGIGGKPDVRRRQDEFDTRGGVSRAELTALIVRTFTDVDRELSAVSSAVVMEGRVIPGQRVSVLEAILHVVEYVLRVPPHGPVALDREGPVRYGPRVMADRRRSRDAAMA
ncbi:MAG: DUF1572 family protein [Gemmatimonadota bacterium]|nr:DUF1572 family protein [Gemmatimonadota bacterium]